MTTKKNSDRNLKLFNFPSDGKSSKNILSKGLLITFEGGEGSGKSTQCKRLVKKLVDEGINSCLLYTSPSPRDPKTSRMPSSA